MLKVKLQLRVERSSNWSAAIFWMWKRGSDCHISVKRRNTGRPAGPDRFLHNKKLAMDRSMCALCWNRTLQQPPRNCATEGVPGNCSVSARFTLL